MNSKKEETLADVIKSVLTLQDHSDQDLKDLIKITLWCAVLIHGLIFALVYWGDCSFGIFNQYDFYLATKSLKEFFNHGSPSSLNLELLFLYLALSPPYFCIFYKVNAKIKGENFKIQRKLGQTVRWSIVMLIFACTPYSVKAKLHMRTHPIPIIADIFSSSDKLKASAAETDVNLDKLMETAIVVPYDELARYPEKYNGLALMLKGQVDQVIGNDIRVAITEGKYGWSDDIYVTLDGAAKGTRLLKNDTVYILGIGANEIQYKGLFDQTVTAPYVKAYGISRTSIASITPSSKALIEQSAIKTVYGNFYYGTDESKIHPLRGALWKVTGAPSDMSSWNGNDVVVVPYLTKLFTEQGLEKALVVTNTILNKDGVKVDCHQCGSLIGAIVLERHSGYWIVSSQNKFLTVDGSWGDPPEISADFSGSVAILHVKGSFMAQGVIESWKYDITFKNDLWEVGEVKRETSGGSLEGN